MNTVQTTNTTRSVRAWKMDWKRTLRILAMSVIGVIVIVLAIAMLVYPPVYVYRTIAWRNQMPLIGKNK